MKTGVGRHQWCPARLLGPFTGRLQASGGRGYSQTVRGMMDPAAINDAGKAGEVIAMGLDNDQSPKGLAPPGRVTAGNESPSSAALVGDLLTQCWFANFVVKAERRPMRRWLAPADYWALVNLCAELAKCSDGNEVTELLDGASDGEEAFAVWCYLIDDATPAVQKRWLEALRACRHALATLESQPQTPVIGE